MTASVESEELFMRAYYYQFEPTGVLPIDRILSAVAHAGKSFHNTADWNDEVEHPRDGVEGETATDWIQNAANSAASEFRSGEDLARVLRDLIAPPTVLTRDAVNAIRVALKRWEKTSK